MYLGEFVERALSTLGVTKDRVEQWVGKPCGCRERKQKLDALDKWARQSLAKGGEQAVEYLRRLIKD